MEDIILLGIGGHAFNIVDSIERSAEFNIVGFLDVETKKEVTYKKYKVLGADDRLRDYIKSGIRNVCVSVGYLGKGNVRNCLYEYVKACGGNLPNIIDPTAIIAGDVRLGEGNFIGKRAIINSACSIGNMCIVNSGSIIEHSCVIDDFTHVSVGSILCGDVCVGKASMIGANATVIQGRTIGDRSIVGAGVTVREDVESDVTYYAKGKSVKLG